MPMIIFSITISGSSNYYRRLMDWLIGIGIENDLAGILTWIILGILVLIVSILSYYIVKKIFLRIVAGLIRKTRTKWDDALIDRKVFHRLSHLAPALVIYGSAHIFGSITDILQHLASIYMSLAGLMAGFGFLNVIEDIYQHFSVSRERPIKGYLQVFKIILAIAVIIIIFAILLGKSPFLLLSGFGAMTAVVMLVFKDSILGLVAGVQLSANDMVRIGDWIEMPKYGADGDVIDISLNTVKVQNWDKTISTIPAYALVSDSFRNWRGMSESGGRRIKRSINIDMTSVKFCDERMIKKFEKFQLLQNYIKTRKTEIEQYNREHNIDTSNLINGRNMTNLGTFRAYLSEYLKAHPKIHNDMTFLIRHLQPGEHGLPIQVYVFSNDQAWANYESIQADIFDHILAVIPEFELRVFQAPSGYDFQKIANVT